MVNDGSVFELKGTVDDGNVFYRGMLIMQFIAVIKSTMGKCMYFY